MALSPKTLTVAAAIIEYRGRYLICKRAPEMENGGLWEFPGGKIEDGETLQKGLEREIFEELGVRAIVGKVMSTSETYTGTLHLRLFGMQTILESKPASSKDHSEIRWATPDEFRSLPMTEAEMGLILGLELEKKEKSEIESLGIWSFAKVFGLVYGFVGVFVGMFLFFTSMAFSAPLTNFQRLLLALSLPFLHLVVGGFFGAFIAIVYNVTSTIAGGIKIRLRA